MGSFSVAQYHRHNLLQYGTFELVLVFEQCHRITSHVPGRIPFKLSYGQQAVAVDRVALHRVRFAEPEFL